MPRRAMRRPKCMRPHTPHPAIHSTWITLALLTPVCLAAQSTVSSPTRLRVAPSGTVIADVRAGASVAATASHDGWSKVTLEGYLHRSVVGGHRAGYSISVHAAGGALLRATPSGSGRVLALLTDGAGLTKVSTRGDWIRVRRTAWMITSSLRAAAPTVAERKATRSTKPSSAPKQAPTAIARRAPAPKPAAESTAVAEGDVTPDSTTQAVTALALARRATLYTAPDAASLGTIDSSARVTAVARDRGWVRVQVEGWVRAQDLGPSDSTVLTTISAADLRAQPDRYRGQVVRWVVQKIAVERADPLRKEMAPDEPYILARGPGQENSLLYLALPPSLVDQAKRIDPLASITVTARVRAGRSEPSGVPLLDVLSIAAR